jgi:hypothetical protein
MLVNTLPVEWEGDLLTYRSQLIITDGVVVACTSRQRKGYDFLVRQVCLIQSVHPACSACSLNNRHRWLLYKHFIEWLYKMTVLSSISVSERAQPGQSSHLSIHLFLAVWQCNPVVL